MKSYELTYIISSEMKSEEADNLKKEVELFAQDRGGVIIKSEKTVPHILSYSIKKHASGYFVTLEFQVEEDKIKEIRAKLEKEAKVLRHAVIIKKPIKAVKERRTRKPVAVPSAQTIGANKEATHIEKPALEDIEKKLDEILSE